jgi:hypothetical protein
MTYLLVECSDADYIYRILHFEDTNLTRVEIQDAIYDIKDKFYEDNFEDWTIEDVLVVLSETYDFEEYTYDGNLEV